MVRKILIDTGLNRKKPCSPEPSPAFQIGEALSGRLEQMGYETMFSGHVPELANLELGAGRPSVCAAIARRWHADSVLRLCVRASELPNEGRAEALVFRRQSSAWWLAEAILQDVEAGSVLKSQGVRSASGMLLLRRTPCPGVILVLRLPFRQKESLESCDIENYALCITNGIHRWAQSSEQVGRDGISCRYP